MGIEAAEIEIVFGQMIDHMGKAASQQLRLKNRREQSRADDDVFVARRQASKANRSGGLP